MSLHEIGAMIHLDAAAARRRLEALLAEYDTLAEVAAALRTDQKTLWRWRHRLGLPARPRGRQKSSPQA